MTSRSVVLNLVMAVLLIYETHSCPGREFLVAFLENRSILGPPSPRVYVTSSSRQPVDVTVRLPGMAVGLLWPSSVGPPFYPTNYRLQSMGQSVEISFPSVIQLLGTNVENKAVHIQANGYVTVHVANVGDWSTGVYQAMPLDMIGSLYYVMSYVTTSGTPNQGPSELAVISTSDNTIIQIDMGQNVELSIVDLGLGMTSFTRITQITLNKYQTLQVRNVADMTGVCVKSTDPVVVLSGTEWTALTASSSQFIGSHVAMQLTPVNVWNQLFLVSHVPTRNGDDGIRILASENYTQIDVEFLFPLQINNTINASSSVLHLELLERQYADIRSPSSAMSVHFIRINATRPIMIVQFGYPTTGQGPLMLPVQSFQQISSSYEFIAVRSQYTTDQPFRHFVSILVDRSSENSLVIDNQQPDATDYYTNWTSVPGTNLLWAVVSVSTLGGHRMYTLNGHPAAGCVYGFRTNEAYGYPLDLTVRGPRYWTGKELEDLLWNDNQDTTFSRLTADNYVTTTAAATTATTTATVTTDITIDYSVVIINYNSTTNETTHRQNNSQSTKMTTAHLEADVEHNDSVANMTRTSTTTISTTVLASTTTDNKSITGVADFTTVAHTVGAVLATTDRPTSDVINTTVSNDTCCLTTTSDVINNDTMTSLTASSGLHASVVSTQLDITESPRSPTIVSSSSKEYQLEDNSTALTSSSVDAETENVTVIDETTSGLLFNTTSATSGETVDEVADVYSSSRHYGNRTAQLMNTETIPVRHTTAWPSSSWLVSTVTATERTTAVYSTVRQKSAVTQLVVNYTDNGNINASARPAASGAVETGEGTSRSELGVILSASILGTLLVVVTCLLCFVFAVSSLTAAPPGHKTRLLSVLVRRRRINRVAPETAFINGDDVVDGASRHTLDYHSSLSAMSECSLRELMSSANSSSANVSQLTDTICSRRWTATVAPLTPGYRSVAIGPDSHVMSMTDKNIINMFNVADERVRKVRERDKNMAELIPSARPGNSLHPVGDYYRQKRTSRMTLTISIKIQLANSLILQQSNRTINRQSTKEIVD